VAHVDGVRVVFFDPVADAFALVVVDFTISVGVKLFEDGSTYFFVLFLHGFAHGFTFRLAEFAIAVGVEAFEHFGAISFSHFIASSTGGFALLVVEFAVAIFVEFFNDVRGEFTLAFFALASLALFALTLSLAWSLSGGSHREGDGCADSSQ